MLRPMELYELILDNIYNGVLITDAQGYVIYMNRPYGEFLGLDPQAQVGKHCTEVLEFSRMHIVAQTGREELNQAQWINGQNMVVQRIPIRKDDQVVAVYGQVMFKNAREVGDLAARLSLLQSKVEMYKQELIHLRATRYTFESIVGLTPAILDLKKTARRAAHGDAAVLISGESGTGKELFAQAIHQASPRCLHPFVRINCAAIPHDLLESELFGYASGAFTGASAKGKPGKFELAHQGTIFLDEIGELPLDMQPKLLEALEEKAFERVGGTTVIQSDFRLIAATNQNLETLIEKNRFRADLYYRLNVIPIQIPPLRERTADIPLLARHILDQLTQESARPPVTLSDEAEPLLNAYHWPGNVRELVNAMERILLTLEGRTILAQHLPLHLQGTPKAAASRFGTRNLKQVLERTEAELIQSVLSDAGGNKVIAARQLGIHRTHLYKKLKKVRAGCNPEQEQG